jgi:hypothetical protein
VASTNDQLGTSGAVGSVDEADPGVVLDRLEAGAASALYTHDTAGSFGGEGGTGAHREIEAEVEGGFDPAGDDWSVTIFGL